MRLPPQSSRDAAFSALLLMAERLAAVLHDVRPAVFAADTLREPEVGRALDEFHARAPAWRMQVR